MQDIRQPLAIAVREARKKHGLSQEKLAETIKLDTRTNLQKLLALLNDCTEQEAEDLLPAIQYLLELLRKQNTPSL